MTEDHLAREVLERLTTRGMTVAVAESLTGGLLLATLTAVPGASSAVMGGVVSYSNSVKQHVLGVDADVLREHGPVHRVVAEQMASSVALLCGANIGIATTGVAGPGDQDGVAAGTFWVAMSASGHCEARQERVDGNRSSVRLAAVCSGLTLLLAATATGDNSNQAAE